MGYYAIFDRGYDTTRLSIQRVVVQMALHTKLTATAISTCSTSNMTRTSCGSTTTTGIRTTSGTPTIASCLCVATISASLPTSIRFCRESFAFAVVRSIRRAFCRLLLREPKEQRTFSCPAISPPRGPSAIFSTYPSCGSQGAHTVAFLLWKENSPHLSLR